VGQVVLEVMLLIGRRPGVAGVLGWLHRHYATVTGRSQIAKVRTSSPRQIVTNRTRCAPAHDRPGTRSARRSRRGGLQPGDRAGDPAPHQRVRPGPPRGDAGLHLRTLTHECSDATVVRPCADSTFAGNRGAGGGRTVLVLTARWPVVRGRGCPLYVCSCWAVSSRTIAKLIRDGVTTVEDVGRICGAGTGCGTCRPTIEAMLEGTSCQAAGRPASRNVPRTERGQSPGDGRNGAAR
jgi:bacterioferritin-associated ferredoxin